LAANDFANHSRDAHCNDDMAPQNTCGAEPQSGSAERLAAFRQHMVIIAYFRGHGKPQLFL